MMRLSLVLVSSLLLAGMAVALSPRPAPAVPRPVRLYVDNQPLDFTSRIVSGIMEPAHMPALLVGNHAMLPVRLFAEVLGDHLDLHLDLWGITQLVKPDGQAFALKVGESEAVTAVAMIGGDVGMRIALSVPPTIINGRLYVPAMFARDLGHAVRWDATANALYITRRAQPAAQPPAARDHQD